MNSKYIPKLIVPTQEQQEFLDCSGRSCGYIPMRFVPNQHLADTTEQLDENLMGTGKTTILLVDCVLSCEKYAGCNCLILERRFVSISRPGGLLDILRDWFSGKDVTYSARNRRFTFPNGSVIQVDYCSDEKDMMKFQGSAFDRIYVDNQSNFTHRITGFLSTRIRTDRPYAAYRYAG